MLKRFIIAAITLISFSATAQQSVGSWEILPVYSTAERVIETPSKVYCLSGGTLFSFDKESEELYDYNIGNLLSETSVTNIFYNKAGKYLAVVYDSGNIDVLRDNGEMVNVSDIRDAVISSARNINDIAFANDKMYVATSFGIVIFNDKNFNVKESAIYNTNVKYIGVTDSFISAFFSDKKQIGFLPVDSRINDINNFTLIERSYMSGLKGLKGNEFIASITSSPSPVKMVYNDEAKSVGFYNTSADQAYAGPFPCEAGYYFYNTTSTANSNIMCVKIFDTDYNVTTINLPANLSANTIGYWSGNSLWSADEEGLGEYSIGDDSSLTVLHDRIARDAIETDQVGSLYASPSGKIYVMSAGFLNDFSSDWGEEGEYYNGSRGFASVNIIEDGKITDVTPRGLTLYKSTPGQKDGTFRTVSPYRPVEDPNDPSIYYFGTYQDGVYKMRGSEQLAAYNPDNSTIGLYANRTWTYCVDFDKRGNLWVGRGGNSGSGYGLGSIQMLPADKVKLNQTVDSEGNITHPTTAEDWVMPEYSKDYYLSKDVKMLVCKKSNIIIITARLGGDMRVIDTKGTDTPDDDTYFDQTFPLYDQDYKAISISSIHDMMEDAQGRIWFAYDLGLFMCPDANTLVTGSPKLQRIKVPRNDGTNFADYLLENETVISIVSDGIDRKWIGTYNSGAYLVSPDGTQILQHFDTSNSNLPSNKVFGIACDTESNAVYFGGPRGVARYLSDAAPAASDYSEVYAYPNPVRPDYTGWITVTGLMNDSLVKIADAAGNVFFEGMSQGGMITWDGCDRSGNRVKTGVYYVLASQNATGSSSGAVAKILVVN